MRAGPRRAARERRPAPGVSRPLAATLCAVALGLAATGCASVGPRTAVEPASSLPSLAPTDAAPRVGAAATGATGTAGAGAAGAASAPRADARLDRRRRLLTNTVIAGAGIAVLAYGGNKWWGDGVSGDFRTQYEGWFGRDTRYGGADKLGHAYSNYLGTRLLTWTFEGIGHDPERARRLAFYTTLGTFTAVEVIDGFAKGWAFSKEDALMNLAGAGIGYLSDKHPDFDDLVDFRLQYRPSTTGSTRSAWDPLADYGGQTWILAIKGSGIARLRNRKPWRYLELAIGYNARGFEDPAFPEARSRRLYLGISLNLSRVLDDTVFRERRDSRIRRIVNGTLEFVQVPGTAAYYTHRF